MSLLCQTDNEYKMNIIYRASKESGSIASTLVNWRLLSGVQLIWVEIVYKL